MASIIPKFVKKEITDGWVAETWKLMLLSNSHTPNAGTQQYVSDVVANEISDTGGIYKAGGVAVSGKHLSPMVIIIILMLLMFLSEQEHH